MLKSAITQVIFAFLLSFVFLLDLLFFVYQHLLSSFRTPEREFVPAESSTSLVHEQHCAHFRVHGGLGIERSL